MSKVKLNSVLFEYMERITEKKYKYSEFVNELSRIDLYYDDFYYKFFTEEEVETYFRGPKKDETFEKLLKAYMFGYEEEIDKYTITLAEKDGIEYILWDLGDMPDVAPRDEYIETEEIKCSFTMEEILRGFPHLALIAQKNK